MKECLDSIMNQSLREIEIIIINDGSTDNSREIILGYAEKDSRIIFMDSVNEGVSSARNKGIDKATGKYIGFVDADDYIETTMYQRLFDIAEEKLAPLAICNAMEVSDKVEFKGRLPLKNECVLVSDKAGLLLDFLSFKYDSANWNKIYATDIIKHNNLEFEKQLSIWEDLLFNLQFVAYVNKIVVLKEGLYYYRVHPTSIMTDSKLSVSDQYNLFYKEYLAFCNKNSLSLEKEIFIKERAETCIPNLFVLLKLRMRAKIKFFKLTNQFGNELKVLNPAIYTQTKSFKTVSLNFYWLLRLKFFRLFAFLYVSNYMIKK